MTQSSRCLFCGMQANNPRVDAQTALATPTLDQLINSNIPPTISQSGCIRDRINTLDEAIENLRNAQSLLEQEKADLSRIMSPIRRVPPELLLEIFTIYAESRWERLGDWQRRGVLPKYRDRETNFDFLYEWGIEENPSPYKEPGRGLLVDPILQPSHILPQVCRGWRAAARACSNLWSYISFHTNYFYTESMKQLKKHLRLSANRPLHIHISQESILHPDFQLVHCLRKMLSVSRRWKSISMAIDTIDNPVFPRASISSSFPSLVSLSLIIRPAGDFTDPDYDDGFVYKFTAADMPLLREVSLTFPELTYTTFDLPWAQLHKFRFWGQDGDHLMSIVGCLRDVVELDLIDLGYYTDPPDTLPIRSLHLPSLRCLRLSNFPSFNPRTLCVILPRLKIPALQSLYWTGMDDADLKSLYDTCSAQDIDGGPDTDYQVCLRELHLYNPENEMLSNTSSVFLGESWEDLFNVVGPHLESFQIEYPTSSGANVSKLLELLGDRIEAQQFPNFHHCAFQGVHINSVYLVNLIISMEPGSYDIRVRNCTINTGEEFEDAPATMFKKSIPSEIPTGVFLELDVEASNGKRLVYRSDSDTGLLVEESCRCKVGGISSSLWEDSRPRSSILRVI